MKCLRCASCCRYLIIEVTEYDKRREPKIRKVIDNKEFVLGCGEARLCPFLKGNKCSIYKTRPTVCRYFEPGCDQCIMARERTSYANKI